MQKITPVLLTLLVGLLAACTDKSSSSGLKTYFADSSGIPKTGGVRMIAIHTPKGDFNVWTKRFGNNPTNKSAAAAWRAGQYTRSFRVV